MLDSRYLQAQLVVKQEIQPQRNWRQHLAGFKEAHEAEAMLELGHWDDLQIEEEYSDSAVSCRQYMRCCGQGVMNSLACRRQGHSAANEIPVM